MTPEAQPMTPKDIDRLARRRAGAKLGWYIHATAFVVINLALFAISHHGFGSRHWTVFPLLGWGLGLALHGQRPARAHGAKGARAPAAPSAMSAALPDRDGAWSRATPIDWLDKLRN